MTSNPWRLSITRNITWLTGASIAVKPIWLLFVLVLCWRFLGTNGYGVFSTALWLAFIPASLTDLGLTNYTTREVARAPEKASEFFSNLLSFKILLALIAWIITIGAALLLDYGRQEMFAVAWAGVYAVVMSALTYVRAYFRAFQNLRLEGSSIIVEKLVVISFGTIALLIERTAHATLAAMSVGLLLVLIMNVVWIGRNLVTVNFDLFSTGFIRKALRVGIPLGLYSFFIATYLRIGGVFLERWHGVETAGEFAGAYRIVEAMFLLPSVFTAAILPRLSSLYHQGEFLEFRRVLKAGAVAGVGISVVAAAVFTFLGLEITYLINPTDGGVAAGMLLRVLVWVFPLMVVHQVLIDSLVASDQQIFLAVALGAATAVSIVLHFLLTSRFGPEGLIAVLLITEMIVIASCWWRYNAVLRDPDRPAT